MRILTLFSAVYICFAKYQYYYENEKELAFPVRRTLRTRVSEFFEKKSTWAVLLVLSAVLFVIVVLVLIFLRQRISIAITLIKEGSK